MYDATCVNATSTSVSLLYAERPALDFAAYVSKMETALRDSFQDTLQLTWDHENVVIIDIDGSRVLLGYWEAPDAAAEGAESAEHSCAAVLVLSVGPGPDWRTQTRLSRFRKSLCQSVAAGIMDSNPADMVLWKDFQGVFTTEDFDMLIDQALTVGQEQAQDEDPVPAEPLARPVEDPTEISDAAKGRARAEAREGAQRFGALPVRRLMDRLETEINADKPRDAMPDFPGLPGPASVPGKAATPAMPEVANDMPDLPGLPDEELDRIRTALYPSKEEDGVPNLTQRLTIYTVNTTLMLVALPLGAALLTYNILGGEDARMTARALALTGAFLSLTHTPAGQQLMHMMM